MQKFAATIISLASSVLAGNNAIIKPPTDMDGAPVAMILINGAACDPNAYVDLVEEF